MITIHACMPLSNCASLHLVFLSMQRTEMVVANIRNDPEITDPMTVFCKFVNSPLSTADTCKRNLIACMQNFSVHAY